MTRPRLRLFDAPATSERPPTKPDRRPSGQIAPTFMVRRHGPADPARRRRVLDRAFSALGRREVLR